MLVSERLVGGSEISRIAQTEIYSRLDEKAKPVAQDYGTVQDWWEKLGNKCD